MELRTPNAHASRWLTEGLIAASPRTAEELQEIVTEVGRAPDTWAHAVAFDADRWTHRVLYKTEHLEIALFGWSGGQVTAYHDHGGASGAAFVFSGTLAEERVVPGGGRSERRLRVLGPDSTVSFGPADVHRIHHDPADGNAISIHAYTPALSEPRDYGFGPEGTLRVITQEPELQPA